MNRSAQTLILLGVTAFGFAGCGESSQETSTNQADLVAGDEVGTVSETLSVDGLLQRGEELYNAQVSCWVCHAETGEGRIGPSLLYGPTPADIYGQLINNPQMGIIVEELDPSDEDLVAIAIYIRQLGSQPFNEEIASQFRSALAEAKSAQGTDLVFAKTARDIQVEQIQSFDTVVADWQRRSKTGSLRSTYESETIATFDPGQPKFTPEPGGLYYYENLGNSANLAVLESGAVNAESSQIVVGDARTKEILASYELPVQLRAAVHTTAVSPDGKYVYIVGSKPTGPDDTPSLDTPATMIKADAVTLQPIKQVTIGGRLHHAQVFQDKYLLLDTFSRDQDGLDVMLYDTETDSIVGGIRDEDLGGSSYTAFADSEFIYLLMEPTGYASHRSTGMVGAQNFYKGRLVAMKPFWVAKIDPETWEVVAEYPYSGYRGDWIVIDSAQENMYIPSGGSSNMTKVNLATGNIEWAAATGIGPYGAALTADESEIWVADKGEATGHFGRTITVLEASSGRVLETLFSGYEVDHVLLSPNGREMWATSNGEGRIYVFDAETREQTHKLEMPQHGDPHGLVWVHYDQDGSARVVRDQGGFHGGVNPAKGVPLED